MYLGYNRLSSKILQGNVFERGIVHDRVRVFG